MTRKKHKFEDIVDSGIQKLNQDPSIQEEANLDCTIYTGTGGIAYLFCLLYLQTQSKRYHRYAVRWLKLCLKHHSKPNPKHETYTFLCGITGLYSLAAVLFPPQESIRYVEKLLQSYKTVKTRETGCELLYGKAGYLSGLLFVQKYASCVKQKENAQLRAQLEATITRVAKRIILEGQQKGTPILSWQWHQKTYLGAAHGMTGILSTLLAANQKGDQIWQTVDFLWKQKLPSGNFPSSISTLFPQDSNTIRSTRSLHSRTTSRKTTSRKTTKATSRNKDRLVQFCHGAPGVGLLFLQCFEATQNKKYLDWAKECGQVVEKRGFLDKGISLCHGTCGNSLFLLQLNQHSKSSSRMQTIYTFTDKLLDRKNKKLWHQADEPFCFANGLAGAIYYFHILHTKPASGFPLLAHLV